MIPGEVITPDSDIELNVGRQTLKVSVANTGDRPIQVGSHFHFMKPMMLCSLIVSKPKAID
jgi:urease subunit beta